jgi:hypothetical protein
MRTGLTEDQIIYPYQRETRAPGHTSPGRRGVKMSKADFNWARRLRSIRLQLEASQGKKFIRPHLDQQLGVVAHACYPNYTRSINRKIRVQDGSGINKRPYPQNNLSQKG